MGSYVFENPDIAECVADLQEAVQARPLSIADINALRLALGKVQATLYALEVNEIELDSK